MNLQTMILQIFWGVKEVYYGIVQVVNSGVNCALGSSKSIRYSGVRYSRIPLYLAEQETKMCALLNVVKDIHGPVGHQFKSE